MNKTIFVIFSAIFLVAGLFYFLLPEEINIKSDCDLSKSVCTIEDFEISLNPLPLDPKQPFHLMIKDLKSERKVMETQGFLFGLKPPYLTELIEISKKDFSFEAQEMFPYCSRKEMPWKLQLILKEKKKVYKIVFNFKVLRD